MNVINAKIKIEKDEDDRIKLAAELKAQKKSSKK